jgi:hypothetical protein
MLLSAFQKSPDSLAPGLIFARQFMLPNPQHAPPGWEYRVNKKEQLSISKRNRTIESYCAS